MFTGCEEGKGIEVGTNTGEDMVGNYKEDGDWNWLLRSCGGHVHLVV
jgi:hypothetical protein